ncbi:MAG: shikimate kinase [Desulfobacteraceae bacterium]|nr:shikimate kinase [Desulfobacteraceae bacterium]
MNIVLIGYRGTGKSAVGKIVAERLKMKYISMDARIVEKAGMAIPDIVTKVGWPGFRDLESAVAREFAGQDNLVIDTGGGVIERPENIPALKPNGFIIWLKASPEVIVSRIKDGTQRPALTQGKTFTEEVIEVLSQRTPKYQDAAEFEIDTDTLTPEQVAYGVIEACRP